MAHRLVTREVVLAAALDVVLGIVIFGGTVYVAWLALVG
jgi:hypothetical protein